VTEDPCEPLTADYAVVELFLDVSASAMDLEAVSAAVCRNDDCLATESGDLKLTHGQIWVNRCDAGSCTVREGYPGIPPGAPKASFALVKEADGPPSLRVSYFPSAPVASGDVYRVEVRDGSGVEITAADVTIPQYTTAQTCGHTVTSARIDLRAPRPDGGAVDGGN
jgi:hypothetical protein